MIRTHVRFGLLLAMVLALTVLAGDGTPAYAWTAAAVLNTNAASDSGDDYSPQVTTDGVGHWVAVWTSNDSLGGTIGTDYDILVSRSTNNGATWTAPVALNTNAATDAGDDSGTRATTDGAGNWLVVWHSNENLGGTIGTDYDILVARSTDNGATWTAPAALNTNAATDSGRDFWPQVTTDGAGHWVAVWYSNENLGGTIGTDDDILVARSTDNGAMWTAPAALNTNAATDSGTDRWPEVTTDRAGNWVAVWQSDDSLGGTIGMDEDILVARSTDNGATWTAPAALNTNAATDSGDDGVAEVTTDRVGNWVAVWASDDDLGGTIGEDDDILVARSTNNGATWTAPAALNTNAATGWEWDNRPQVATDGAGRWVAVWDSLVYLPFAPYFIGQISESGSTDNGVTWTDPAALNTNGGGTDVAAQLTTDGAGHWVAVWHSDENLGGTIGTDFDILYATEVEAAPADTIGLYRPSDGMWFLRNTNSTGPADLTFSFGAGIPGVIPIPVVGDWDNDGDHTIGLFQPGTGLWFLRNTNSSGVADLTFSYGAGISGGVPVVGDWDGNGSDTIGIYQPSTGLWFLRNNNSSGVADLTFSYGAGVSGGVPVVGDWDDDHDDTIGIYRPSDGMWFLRNTNSSGVANLAFSYGAGVSGGVPVVGDWNGEGTDTIGIYRPSDGLWFLRNANSSGVADLTFSYGAGISDGVAAVGDWDGL